MYDGIDSWELMSRLERDLLLQYVRSLYDTIMPPKGTSTKYIDNTYNTQQEQTSKNGTASRVQPIDTTTHTSPTTADQVEQNPITEEKQPIQPIIADPIAKEIQDLFEECDTKDPGSRYTQSKINDIARSMGINDKILTINELFDGDQGLFNKTIDKLNNMSSYDEAKTYLTSSVLKELDWTVPNRRGKAITFLNLIKRRY